MKSIAPVFIGSLLNFHRSSVYISRQSILQRGKLRKPMEKLILCDEISDLLERISILNKFLLQENTPIEEPQDDGKKHRLSICS